MKLTKGKIGRMLKTNHQTLKRRPVNIETNVTAPPSTHFTRVRKRPHLSNKTICNVKRYVM